MFLSRSAVMKELKRLAESRGVSITAMMLQIKSGHMEQDNVSNLFSLLGININSSRAIEIVSLLESMKDANHRLSIAALEYCESQRRLEDLIQKIE